MNRRIARWRRFCLYLVAGCCFATSSAEAQLGVPSVAGVVQGANGSRMPYRVVLPHHYDPNQQYPLVLFLHGAGERGTDNQLQVNSNIAGLITATRSDEFASILVAPQTAEGWGSFEARSLISLVLEDVATTYDVDRRRFYVTGLSMGGYGTFDLAAERSELFAAAVPIASGFQPSRAADLLDVNLWAIVGDRDDLGTVQGARNTIAALRELGGNPRFTEYPGAGHNDSWHIAYQDVDRELYPWLFSQIRPVPEPVTILWTVAGSLLCVRSRRRRSTIPVVVAQDRS